jgi:iron complex transport system ATP-binding protein
MTPLVIDSLTVTRGPATVLAGLSFRVGPGECLGLIGPNGAGKTTLLRAALGLLPATGGTSSLAALDPQARARAAAWLPQDREIAWPVTVTDLVALGRLPHGDGATPAGRAAVARAIDRIGIAHLARRPATELSGGERARALIARAFAQDAPLILADEPVAGLDAAAQIAAMRVFRNHADRGGAVLTAIHDLGLAARHCTRLIVLSEGRLAADGPPRDVLTPGLLARVFGLTAHVTDAGAGLIVQPTGLTTDIEGALA